MKRYLGIGMVAFAAMVAVSLAGCKPASRIDYYPEFESKYVPARVIRVWVPADYSRHKRYDVLYMHDGKMLFDATMTWNGQEWGVDEAMDSLSRQGIIRPTIVVGIDNTDERISEYCPDDIAEFLPEGHGIYAGLPAKGNDYLRFLVEEVKPFIDSVYSTWPDKDHTWVMGSSCGGLISSYALCKYPDVFGGAVCMSTHCTLAYPDPNAPDSAVMAAYRAYLKKYLRPNEQKVYMDRGDETLDAFYGAAQDELNAMFQEEGWDERHFVYRFFPGAAHCEDDWKARLDIPLCFLLNEGHSPAER